MRFLIVDDEPDNVQHISRILKEALDAEIDLALTVQEALGLLHAQRYDLVLCDVFIPLGEVAHLVGRRGRLPAGQDHLGGLVLLDEVDRMMQPPKLLVHTACNEHAMVSLLQEHGHDRVPKPAPVDVLLRAVLQALELPSPS